MPAVLLVVPVGPTPHELLPSLVALRAATRDRDVETRVVDLYVDPERRAGLVELVAGWARCDLVDAGPCAAGESPLVRAVRVALPTSRAGLVAVVAPRALLPEGALSRLRSHLERDPGVALVAPLAIGGGADALPPTPGAGYRALDAVAREAGHDRTAVLTRPRGDCLVLRRAALEDAGLERLQDLEGLAAWLRAAGWQSAVALDVVVQPELDAPPEAEPPAPGVAALREAAAVESTEVAASWRARATGALRRATGHLPVGRRRSGGVRLDPRRRDVERLRRPGALALNLLACPLPRLDALAASRLEVERAIELALALSRLDVDVRLLGVEPWAEVEPLAGEPAVYRDARALADEAPDADAWLAVGHAAGAWLPSLAGRAGLRALRLEDDDALAAPPGDPARLRLEATLAAAGRAFAPSRALLDATRPLVELAWPLVAGSKGAEPGADLLELRPGARTDLFRPSARTTARRPGAPLRLRVDLDPEAPSRGGAWALREAFGAGLVRPAGLEVVATPEAARAAGLGDALVPLPREPEARAAVVAADDVFVDPEPRRAPSSSAREALASGLACVLVEPGDASLADGREALLVPPRDPGALRAALERLLGDAALRARLGEGARAWARAWTLDDEAAALVEALRPPTGPRR